MDLRTIYLTNGVGIYLLLVLQYVSKEKVRRGRLEDRIFGFLIIGVLLGCSMELLSYALDGHVFPGAVLMNHFANTCLFSINLLMPFCVLAYIDLSLYDDRSRIWKYYKPQIIIGMFMLSANIVNLFVPVSYNITAQNVYERRPFGYVYYFVILYYCITALVVTKKYEKENGASAFLSINMFLIPILIGAGLQFMFYGLSMAWLSAAIGLIGLFMMQQNELAFVDPLVEVYNRQYLNHLLSAWINRSYSFAGIMADIDHFKSINDRFGHSEGDRALKKVADILKQSRVGKEWVFRFAGDEFIILEMTRSTDTLVAYMREVEMRLEEYNNENPAYQLRLSYGIAYFEAGSVDAFMKEMDQRMYEMKASHHGISAPA